MKPIKTTQDHAAAIARIRELIELQPSEGSPENDELEVLTILAEAYEKEKLPRDLPDPIESIKLRADQLGLGPQDLEPIFGSRSKVSEVLNRKRALSLTMIRKANRQLGISSDVLLQEPNEKQSNAQKLEVEAESLPIQEMWKRGYFPSAKGKTKEWLKKNASNLLRELYTAFSNEEPEPVFCRKSQSQPTCPTFTAWQARCTQLANDIQAPLFKTESLTEKLPREVAKLSFYEEGPRMAIDLLKRKGMKVVILQHLPGTKLDGAAFKTQSGHPTIGLTLRFDRADNFWFTLLHEIGHVYHDLNNSKRAFFDNREDTLNQDTQNPVEQRANSFAANALIPSSLWKKRKNNLLASPTPKNVYAFADELEIDPAIVAGRISWELNDYRKLAKVTNASKIRHCFTEA